MRYTLEISNFYKFFRINASELAVKKLSLEARGTKCDLSGLLILAEEGLNGTVAGSFEAVRFFEQSLPILFGNSDWSFKRGHFGKHPFKDFRVKVRNEIVTTRQTIRGPICAKNQLAPAEWQRMLETDPNAVLIDVRNAYETQLGMFRGAFDPNTENFTEFPEALRKLNIPLDKRVMLYCTGGIRCEKAIIEAEEQGYNEVFQLGGGILRYLEEFPHHAFEGECFVFDGRVAVDQNLNPTRNWSLCPHCGQPGRIRIHCEFCLKEVVVCAACREKKERQTCSHDCRYRILHQHVRAVSAARSFIQAGVAVRQNASSFEING